MASEYTIVKDSKQTITETVTGKNLTGASITWKLVSLGADFSAAFADITALVSKTVGSGITITDGAGGVFAVTLNADDTDDFEVGTYYVVMSVILSGQTERLPIRAYEVTIGV